MRSKDRPARSGYTGTSALLLDGILLLQFFHVLTDTRSSAFTSSTASISGPFIPFFFEAVDGMLALAKSAMIGGLTTTNSNVGEVQSFSAPLRDTRVGAEMSFSSDERTPPV